jgi:hypothetical protein
MMGLPHCSLPVQEALSRDDAEMWVAAINGELKSLFEKQVYDECKLPTGKRAITTRFILHIKRDIYGNIGNIRLA